MVHHVPAGNSTPTTSSTRRPTWRVLPLHRRFPRVLSMSVCEWVCGVFIVTLRAFLSIRRSPRRGLAFPHEHGRGYSHTTAYRELHLAPSARLHLQHGSPAGDAASAHAALVGAAHSLRRGRHWWSRSERIPNPNGVCRRSHKWIIE